MSYGLLPEGFVIPSLQDIKSEMEDEARATYGASIDTSPESVFGQWIGIQAERESSLWELALALWNARSKNGAGGVTQDNLYELTGTIRAVPRKSTVVVRWTGTNGTPIPAGRIMSVSGQPTNRWLTQADATVGGGGYVDITMASEEYGPAVANAGTLTIIETPVGGITSATNPLDAELGAGEETDAAFSIRQEEELRGDGNAAVEAVRSRLLRDVEGVTAVTIFPNTTLLTNADGVPAKALEVMVDGGADQDIREALWNVVGGGIETHGVVVGTVVDEQGDTHTVKFTRPTLVPISLRLTYEKTSGWDAVNGDAALKTALVARGEAVRSVGADVILSQLQPAFWAQPGAHKLTSIEGSVFPAAVGASDVVIGTRELADFDSSRITLVASTVVPP